MDNIINNVTPEYGTLCNNIINIVDDYDRHTLADANTRVLDLRDAIDDVTHIVNVWNVADAIRNAHIARGYDNMEWHVNRFHGVARALIAFCDKRDLTLYAVYVSHEYTLRAIVIRSDGMARRVWEYIRWRYATDWRADGMMWKPIRDMRINRFHVRV